MEILGRARKSPRTSENFGNASNPFLRSLNDLLSFWKTLETVQECIPNVFMIFKIFGKIFGNPRKFAENFGNSSKVIFRCFYDFLKFSENLRKSSEVFGNLRKRLLDVIGNVRNGSQEFKSLGAGF